MSVEHYLIVTRSVTHAQRIRGVLSRAGIRCRIFRAPMSLADKGCAYAVRIEVSDLAPALTALRREALDPVSIFLQQRDIYREVRP